MKFSDTIAVAVYMIAASFTGHIMNAVFHTHLASVETTVIIGFGIRIIMILRENQK